MLSRGKTMLRYLRLRPMACGMRRRQCTLRNGTKRYASTQENQHKEQEANLQSNVISPQGELNASETVPGALGSHSSESSTILQELQVEEEEKFDPSCPFSVPRTYSRESMRGGWHYVNPVTPLQRSKLRPTIPAHVRIDEAANVYENFKEIPKPRPKPTPLPVSDVGANDVFGEEEPFSLRRFLKSVLFGSKKKARTFLLKHTPLERALMEKRVTEKIANKEMGLFLYCVLIRPSRSLEYCNALIMYEKVHEQAHAPQFLGSSLKPTFSTWRQLCFMYLWLLDFRFRYVDDARKADRMNRHIIEYFWQDLEIGLADTLESTNPLLIVKYSKHLLNKWFGAALAYDVGVTHGDTSLAESLWRNLFDSNPEVPLSEIALMVDYIRQEQKKLADLSDERFLDADFEFSPPPFIVPEREKARIANSRQLVRPDLPATDPINVAFEAGRRLLRLGKKKPDWDPQRIHEDAELNRILKTQYQKVIEREKLKKMAEESQKQQS